MSIAIVTDSTSNISKDLAKQLGIHLVYLRIEFSDQSYTDGDLTVEELFEKIEAQNEIPSSSQPNVGEVIDLYEKLSQDYDEILSIHVASSLSGTYQGALLAAEQSGANVTVYDSGLVSNMMGDLVIKAREMVDEGASISEITEKLDAMKENSYTSVVIDTTDNLVKGGRVPAVAGRVLGALNIKPIVHLVPNSLTLDKVARSKKKAIRRMIEKTSEHAAQLKEDFRLVLLRTNNPEEVEAIRQELLAGVFAGREIGIEVISPVVSVHAGPLALGLAVIPQ